MISIKESLAIRRERAHLTWVSEDAAGVSSTAFLGPSAPSQEVWVMKYESDWDGFTTLVCSGVVEALDAAGVDCSVHKCFEPAEEDVRYDREHD